MSDGAMKVIVDEQRCAASTICVNIAPDLFELPDDADTVQVRVARLTDPEQIARAREAMDSCPTLAIDVVAD